MKKKAFGLIALFMLMFATIQTSQAKTIASGDFWTLSDDGHLDIWKYQYVITGNEGWKSYKNQIKSIEIGGVAYINEYAFADYTNVTSLEISSNTFKIYRGAFSGCTSLKSADLSSALTDEISWYAFEDCTSLTDVKLPNRAVYVCDRVFDNCTSLTSFTIPSAVETFNDTFIGCSNLTEINVAEGNPSYCSADGVLFTKDMKTLLRFPEGKNTKDYVIPDGVERIGDFYGAFTNCRYIETLTFPSSLNSLYKFGGDGCSSLTAINVNSANTTYSAVDGVLFSKDKKTLIQYPIAKTGIYYIPDGTTSLESYAFAYTTELKKVVIPNSITSLGYHIFRDSQLQAAYYRGTEEDLNEILAVDEWILEDNSDLMNVIHYDCNVKEEFGCYYGLGKYKDKVKVDVTVWDVGETENTIYLLDNSLNIDDIIVFAGHYSDGKFLGMQEIATQKISNTQLSVNGIVKGEYKIFVWDKDLCPLIIAID